MKPLRFFSAWVLVFIPIFLNSLVAEEFDESLALLESVPKKTSSDAQGLVVNGFNAVQYQSLIVPELRTFVRSGAMQFEAFRSLAFQPSIGNSFLSAPLNPSLDDDGLLQVFPKQVQGPLFSVPATASAEQAIKLLWNAAAIHWSAAYMSNDIAIQFVRNDNAFRTFSASYQRVYPSSVLAEDATKQLFRSRLTFSNPETVRDYSWLTFRFLDAAPDVLFMHSPVLKKNRQLTASNRSDPLLGTAVAATDLLLWSDNIADIDARIDTLQTYLIPVIDIDRSAVQFEAAPKHCERYVHTEGAKLWNYESQEVSQSAAWLPTTAVYIPRKLYRISLTPKDPYSMFGRQILYLDAALHLPIYKVVYDKAGNLWKTMIAVHGFSAAQNRKRSFALLQQIVLDSREEQQSLLDYRNVMTCTGAVGKAVLQRFSPNSLLPESQ